MTTPAELPDARVTAVNAAPVRPEGGYVLYWMIAYRRTRGNHSLDRALRWARELNRPLLVFEPLRCDYPWASDRLHAFVLAGMRDNRRRCAEAGVAYYPYVEPQQRAGAGLLAALAARACVVVTDDWPCFFLPRMVAAAGEQLGVRLEKVDGNGLLPIRAAGRVFPTAFAFRRYLQSTVLKHIDEGPRADPIARLRSPAMPSLPPAVTRRWPAAIPDDLSSLPIDHTVAPAGRGGSVAAHERLAAFVAATLPGYETSHNTLDEHGTSGLSPYLHFGHAGAHEVFDAVMRRAGWSLEKLNKNAGGKRHGFWGVAQDTEAFLDQLVTWRELGFNMCTYRDDYAEYDSLPGWARQTLADHADDPRPHLYTVAQLERAATADPLWNAAQNQLVRDGVITNYLRMLWGKKILEWSPSPQKALACLIRLNDRYALDGRDPNSYTNILWIFGRYDRPWGPERPIFGKVRYMSSDNTARKMPTRDYLRRYGS
ncbi:Deoxyribodipyrimidine photo-lyase type II [Nannocystis exedens]|uniref:Deoxyribodipyrimidine photo-lyase n=1 Tax=Nannocystis exedens TaxID=54 RepID=A0A1I1YPU1_9BACT|nr:deoxyribodipyrimidine photolyase [Nannocystis exedens]PCC70226.1 deoxyribodipyrimidine photo-lyase [Nannocystis exedens]SFE21625.1 Deoxyribodipyrimidine photo-lyase type II [Nannocystis exedens]